MSNLAKRKQNVSSGYWLKKADAAWGEAVHRRESRCLIGEGCSGPLEAHHLISRSVRATRHDPANGICLCSLHHKWSPRLSPHGGPAGFFAWLQEYRPELWEYVRQHRHDISSGKHDYKAAFEALSNFPRQATTRVLTRVGKPGNKSN